MKKNIIIIFSLIVLTSKGQTTFQKTFGTSTTPGMSLGLTYDGGYIISGLTTSSPFGDVDIYLQRIDSNGNHIWSKTFRIPNYDDFSTSIQQTTDSGFILTGYTRGLGAGNGDMIVIKTDNDGNVVWTKTYGGSSVENAEFIQQISSGGYLVAGATQSFGVGSDILLIMTDSLGNPVWSKTYGDLGADAVKSVQQVDDGGYAVAGWTTSFGVDSSDVFLMRIDSGGNILWAKTYGGSKFDYGNSFQQTNDHGFIIGGSSSSFDSIAGGFYLLKTDSTGNLLWSKTLTYNYDQGCSSVKQTIDGGYIMVGSSYDSIGHMRGIFIKTDSNGNPTWQKKFAGNVTEGLYSVQQTHDSGYVMTGFSNSFASFGPGSGYLIKTDSNGNSGCNEFSINIVVISPPTVTRTVNPIVTNPAVIVLPQSLVEFNGATVSSVCITGINEPPITENNFTIYPNPVMSELRIQNAELRIESVDIYDIFGRHIINQQPVANSPQQLIDVSTLSNGVYFVCIKNKQSIFSKKFIVSR